MSAQQNLLPYVNPLIGTQRMGHTYPGATVPFGMVQLSPDTDTVPYEKEGKYMGRYMHIVQVISMMPDDRRIQPHAFQWYRIPILGFSDYADRGIATQRARRRILKWLSVFLTSEQAEPGYYKVKLDDDGIIAELTATTRVGFPSILSRNRQRSYYPGSYPWYS
jgi:putative alpha-1,2-mannosidase